MPAATADGPGRGPRLAAALLAGCVAGAVAAAQPEPLPEPLTLGAALRLAMPDHPELRAARARVAAGEAAVRQAAAADDLRAGVEAGMRWIEPYDEARFHQNDDHRLALVVRKRLWDFGYTAARTEAAELRADALRARLTGAAQHRALAVMERFLDVILADLRYARDTEAMAVAFVDLDKRRERHALGQASDLELLEQESVYQQLRRQRAASQAARRATRAALAEALGRPGELSADLILPELPGNRRPLPDLAALQARALEGNAGLEALRARVASARQALAAARRAHGPRIHGELEAGTYSRRLSSRTPVAAGLVLDLPLYLGDRVEAQAARARAELAEAEAELAAGEAEVRQAVLEHWLALESLALQREAVLARADYRELELDRSRALYELEVRADLGDAMVQSTAARLARVRTEVEAALAWARLDALVGLPAERIAARALEGVPQ